MNMKDWAKREVEIACKDQGGDEDDSFCGYYKQCCESALRAYDSLAKDDHSGMSIQVTKQILNRLIEHKPLTAIVDEDSDIWTMAYYNKEEKCNVYQCGRMSSLFKSVYDDGRVTYSDVDRAYGFNPENPEAIFGSGRVTNIVDERYPITMPYYPPDKRYAVAVEEFLVDPDNGDFDTMGILYMIKPDDEREEINKFYHETKEGFKEISKDLYNGFKKMAETKEKGEY